MQHQASDEILAQQAQQGDEACFELLVRRLQAPLLHFLARRTGSLEDAEELVQDAFLRAHRNLHRYDAKWRFRTWLFTIAARICHDRFRKQRPTHEPAVLETMADNGVGPEERIQQQESHGLLWQQVADLLSARQLDAVWLFYVEQMSVEEIAKVLGATRVGARALLFRARRKLFKSLPRELFTDLSTEKAPVLPAGRMSHA